jgi:hypothetical protein
MRSGQISRRRIRWREIDVVGHLATEASALFDGLPMRGAVVTITHSEPAGPVRKRGAPCRGPIDPEAPRFASISVAVKLYPLFF